MIWDTDGKERFRNMVGSYVKGSHAVLFVYDISNRASFNNLTQIIQDSLSVLDERA